MWSNLPFDVLANIFSFLSLDSLARARSACRNWHACVKSYPLILTRSSTQSKAQPAWFLAMPIRNHYRPCCYAHNPVMNNWHKLSLEFLPIPSIRLVASIGSLLLLRVTNSTMFKLILCNPFTRQFRYLPKLNISRTNPAVGVTILESNYKDVQFQFPCFRVYVAGGMSEAAQGGGATYETTSEMYDSQFKIWQIVGSMPVEFSVRLTVWTPNENVYIKETLYWITSARAYSVIGFDIITNTWRELGVPMAERLEFATLVKWNGALALVGGICGGSACIWELNEGDIWCLKDVVPVELGLRLLSVHPSFAALCLQSAPSVRRHSGTTYSSSSCSFLFQRLWSSPSSFNDCCFIILVSCCRFTFIDGKSMWNHSSKGIYKQHFSNCVCYSHTI